MSWIYEYLLTRFPIEEPKRFYSEIFEEGFLQEKGAEHFNDGKCNALAVEITKNKIKYINDKGNEVEKPKINRYTINDGLEAINDLLEKDNFILLSPISYVGRKRDSRNARYIHALAIDVDGITKEKHLSNLLWFIDGLESKSGIKKKGAKLVPKPTYIVFSGTGLHYYYVFKRPIPLYENVVEELQRYKDTLTKIIWNKYCTDLDDKIQIESLFQGFRLVGGITKDNNRTVAFKTGEKVDIEYMNKYVDEKNKVKHIVYHSNLSLEEAKVKYPEWYEKVVVNKEKCKGYWKAKDRVNGDNPYALYEWWLNKIKENKSFGHRYFCIMCLSVYAMKTGVEYERLENDAMSLIDDFDAITPDGEQPFTAEDVLQALEMYNDSYHTFPIDSIQKISNIEIKKNKRNYRKQEQHLKIMRATRDVLYPDGEWRYRGGRKKGSSKNKRVIEEWRKANKDGTIKECIKDTGISRSTVYKYWDEVL